MGYLTQGSIFVGSTKIDDDLLPVAVARFEAFLVALGGRANAPGGFYNVLSGETPLADVAGDLLEHLFEQLATRGAFNDDGAPVASYAERFVAEFVQWWAEPEAADDTAARVDPDNSDRMIVWAGEYDEDEGHWPTGDGYVLSQSAAAAGVTELFGIR